MASLPVLAIRREETIRKTAQSTHNRYIGQKSARTLASPTTDHYHEEAGSQARGSGSRRIRLEVGVPEYFIEEA